MIICYKALPDNLIPSVFKKVTSKKFLIIDLDDYDLAFRRYTDYLIAYCTEKLKALADLIIVGSKILQKWYGGVYVPTPVNTNFFNKKHFDKNYILEKYNLEQSKIILYMGTFRAHKGIKEIFDIFSSVQKEEKDAKLLMVGGIENKELYERYVKYGEKKCGKNIIFTGFQPHKEMPYFLSTSDIFLTPVRDNAIIRTQTPAKVAEAQSMELPIVSSAVGVYKNLIHDGYDGFLLDPNNFAGFKDKLLYLLENDKERIKFGLNARKSCLKNCSIKVIENKIFNLFNKYSII